MLSLEEAEEAGTRRTEVRIRPGAAPVLAQEEWPSLSSSEYWAVVSTPFLCSVEESRNRPWLNLQQKDTG